MIVKADFDTWTPAVAESFFLLPPQRLDIVHTGKLQAIERIGNGPNLALP